MLYWINYIIVLCGLSIASADEYTNENGDKCMIKGFFDGIISFWVPSFVAAFPVMWIEFILWEAVKSIVM